jgi:hypothetical protein
MMSYNFCATHASFTNNGGVIAPKGIGRLTAVHTLGVTDVSAAIGLANLKELRNTTQLCKLRVSGVNQGNYPDLCSAISGHTHLAGVLSVRLDSGSLGFLNGDGVSSLVPYREL